MRLNRKLPSFCERHTAAKRSMFLGESLRFSAQALRANPVRSLLTGLGMVIGTASVILVVTISLTSRDYILEQVEGMGSNIIFAYYVTGGPPVRRPTPTTSRWRTWQAIRQELAPDICAATGVMSNFDHVLIGGKQRDVKMIGTDEYYSAVRNMVISTGRFLDAGDIALPREGRAPHRSPGGAHVRQPRRRPRPGHAPLRLAIHRDRHISRACGDFRPVGNRARYRPDSDYRAALFHARRTHRPALRPGAPGAGRWSVWPRVCRRSWRAATVPARLIAWKRSPPF